MAKVDKIYHSLLNKIIKNGIKYEDPNRKGVYRYQIPSYTIEHNFKDGFPAITTKKLYWKGIVGELLWFLKGDTNIKYLVDNDINIWNKDAYNWYSNRYDMYYSKSKQNKFTLGEFVSRIKSDNDVKNLKNFQLLKITLGDLGRVYGGQWRKWRHREGYINRDVDQLAELINTLKTNPMGTKHIVTAWNPAELDDMALPPCHWSFEILVEPIGPLEMTENSDKTKIPYEYNGPKYKFTLKWHQRSVDTFLGLPFNIASYALLAQIIGKLTNMIPKGIIGDLSNVHIYEPHMDAVKEQLSRDINKYNECKLEEFGGFKMDMRGNIDQWLNSKDISDFQLKNYKSYPAIPAEMLAYK